jgi:hypothetical protein
MSVLKLPLLGDQQTVGELLLSITYCPTIIILEDTDPTGFLYLVRTAFVSYTCIYALHLLHHRPERRICKNYISVFFPKLNIF